MNLGVCYYPEHWPKEIWPNDARRMAELGLKYVRIGEFCWSQVEPEPGEFNWAWLDEAINILGEAGLQVVLGTPTATPPKWLIDQYPEILAKDQEGRPRKFGSRRHYCFSSEAYRKECERIVSAFANRYGKNKCIFGWQTDNEYGCHDTTRSYSENARIAFRTWLAHKYADADKLNKAWGNVFWSQEYRSFDEVDLPNLTATEANPAHWLDFCRFSSDQVISFNKLQCDILRKHSSDKPIIHNFMGIYAGFDHFQLAEDLDIASWDSYPLGFLDVGPFSDEEKAYYRQQGHPDFSAFHHDLYRACGRGRWWVMEQQPGPVNWARNNAVPIDNMVSCWTWEALAHGAETVSYFRWRQAPFAQEQYHAGLLHTDNSDAKAMEEVMSVAEEVQRLPGTSADANADVALIFSYEAKWMFDIQPQGEAWSYWALVLDWYGSLRKRGLNVDIAPPTADMSSYKLVLCPSLPVLHDSFLLQLKNRDTHFVLGPRTGSKTSEFQIPENLTPGALQDVLPLRIPRSESMPRMVSINGLWGDDTIEAGIWLDHAETDLSPVVCSEDGFGLLFQQENISLFTTVPGSVFLDKALDDLCERAGIRFVDLGKHLRVRTRGDLTFAFNYGRECATVPEALRPADGKLVFGTWELPPAGTSCWQTG